MRFRRVGRLAAMVLPIVLWMACGQVYRPVVLPCSEGGLSGCPVESPPTPANFHAVFGISANMSDNPGGALQIDVGGDSIIAETPTADASAPNLGSNPTHAAVSPNDSRVFVAGVGSLSGQLDSVTFFTPVFQFSATTGFSSVSSIALPTQTANITSISEAGNVVTVTSSSALTVVASYSISIAGVTIPGCSPPACNGYNGTFPIVSITGTTLTYQNAATGLAAGSGGTASVPPQPVFLNSIENTAMYVANYNSNSVFAVNTTLNVVSNSAAVGVNPVSLAEAKSQNGLKLYVANQGTSAANSSITSLNTVNLSLNNGTGLVTGFTGTNPVWAVARSDGQKVYVVTQGDGQLVTIDTATDAVVGSLPVGIGANFIFYDPNLNRLYVTNPATSTLYIFSTVGPGDTPSQLAMIPMAGFSLCSVGCSAMTPVSVTALADGSRFYVASYQTATSCPDIVFVGASTPCVIPILTVFNANNFAPEYSTALEPNLPRSTLTLLTDPPFAANVSANQYQYAVPQVAACGPATPPAATTLYTPGSTRFRVFTASSTDSTRVYVSMCDAGAIAVINTTDSNSNNPSGGTTADTVVTDLPMAFSAGTIQSNGLPPNQNPLFLVAGQ